MSERVQTKTLPARIRVKEDPPPDETGGDTGGSAGQFEAIVSVFDNLDSYGDIVRPGAFARTLAEWETKGIPIPIYYSHRLDDPDMNLGHVVSATETDRGLEIVGQLDLDMPKAQTVHRLFKGGRLAQFSFSYAVKDGSVQEGENGAEFYEIRDVDLYEVGPTPVGANPDTELTAVKDARFVAAELARRVKEGRVLSQSNVDTLQSAADAILKVIQTAKKPSDDDSGKSGGGTGSSTAQDRESDTAQDSDRRATLATARDADVLMTPRDLCTLSTLLVPV